MTLQSEMNAFAEGLAARIGGIPKEVTVFTSSGTFTPSARTLARDGWVFVRLKGGGGGGGMCETASQSSAGGGGSGYEWAGWVQVSGATTVTIGAGGAARTGSVGVGNAGGTTSFGALAYAPGGEGGRHQLNINVTSEGGMGAIKGGDGFGANWGGAGAPGWGNATLATSYTATAPAGKGYGAGGAGGHRTSSPDNQGGAGAAGFLEVWEF